MCFVSYGCNSTAKLNHDSNLIGIISWHNHGHSEYNNEIYLVKAKCKVAAKTSRCNLRKVFNDVTRRDQAGRKFSFPSCESTMYRSRRKL